MCTFKIALEASRFLKNIYYCYILSKANTFFMFIWLTSPMFV